MGKTCNPIVFFCLSVLYFFCLSIKIGMVKTLILVVPFELTSILKKKFLILGLKNLNHTGIRVFT